MPQTKEWVVGGIEITDKKRKFMIPVEKRDAETLDYEIKSHVKQGSRLKTDEWSSYSQLKTIPYIQYTHDTVKHKKNFVDPKTGTHTQNVENMWSHLKAKRPRVLKNITEIENYLGTYNFMSEHKSNLWDSFLQVWKTVKYNYN